MSDMPNTLFPKNFFIELLFDYKPQNPTANAILHQAKDYFGNIEIVSRQRDDVRFSPEHYEAYSDGSTHPVQLGMSNVLPFDDKKSVSEFERSQIWNLQNAEDILHNCRYCVKIYDVSAEGQLPKQRAEMLIIWLDTALKLFPSCKAVWIKSSGKLQLAKSIRTFKQVGITKFIYSTLNVRFFNIPQSNEFIVDTVGLYAIGLSDVQFNFNARGLKPSKVADLAYRLAWYVLNTDDMPIKDGDTIDGIDENGMMNPKVQWTCRYEDSLVEPLRPVLDVAAGKYAAGDRTNQD